MGYRWDIYGITKEQHRTDVKDLKKKRVNLRGKELNKKNFLYEEEL